MISSKYYTEEVVINSNPKVRANFFKKTYLTLAFCMLAFFGLLTLFWQIDLFNWWVGLVFKVNFAVYFLLAFFIFTSFLLNFWIKKIDSLILQYFILSFCVFLKAITFFPFLNLILNQFPNFLFYGTSLFLGLFATTFLIGLNKQSDFSFLKPLIYLASIMTVITLVLGFFLGFYINIWITAAVAFFIGISSLYLTSQVIVHEYRNNQAIPAVLTLFCSWFMIFWMLPRLLKPEVKSEK